MDKYQIGLRLRGYAKNYIKALTCEISKQFNLNYLEKRIVPHITFLRPFVSKDEIELITSFENTLSKYKEPIFYTINGFGTFENKEKVLYAKIDKNQTIENIVYNLENALKNNLIYLSNKIKLPSEQDNLNLHCSVVSKGINDYFSEIDSFVKSQNFHTTIQPLLRIYLLKNNFILREFDFYLNKSLERFDAINPFVFDETKKKFFEITNILLSEEGFLLPFPQKFKKINL